MPSPKFLIFFHVFKSSICKAFCAAWSKLCLKEKWQEFYMLSSSKLFQILPLCYATVDLSQIFLRKERSKRGYTNITQLPPICLEKTQLCSATEMPPSVTQIFYKLSSTRGGLNPNVLYPSELDRNRTTLPCLSSPDRIYYICWGLSPPQQEERH